MVRKVVFVALFVFSMVFMVVGVSAFEWSNGSGPIHSSEGLKYIGLYAENMKIETENGVTGFIEADVKYDLDNLIYLTIDGEKFMEEPEWESEGKLEIHSFPLPCYSYIGNLDQKGFEVSLFDDNNEAIFTTLLSTGEYYFDAPTDSLRCHATLTLLGREAEIYEGYLEITLFDGDASCTKPSLNLSPSNFSLSFQAYQVDYKQEQRISTLESWKESITLAIQAIQTSIEEIFGILETCCEEEPPTPVCGNGVLEQGEECDDGNNISGDGCSATCETEGYVRYRQMTSSAYDVGDAVAYSDSCDGSDLTQYGKTNGACIEHKCEDMGADLVVNLLDGDVKLWVRDSENVCVCGPDDRRPIRYNVDYRDASEVEASASSVEANREAFC